MSDRKRANQPVRITRVLACRYTDISDKFFRSFLTLLNETCGFECHDDEPFIFRVDLVDELEIARDEVVLEACGCAGGKCESAHHRLKFGNREAKINDATLAEAIRAAVVECESACRVKLGQPPLKQPPVDLDEGYGIVIERIDIIAIDPELWEEIFPEDIDPEQTPYEDD